ncbi:MAG: hypothetical protein ACJASF_000205 [Vicingaceae bacterium]|jgi:hypothetical protein
MMRKVTLLVFLGVFIKLNLYAQTDNGIIYYDNDTVEV